MSRLLVLGGGLLGAAIARAAGGDVIVASRTARPHPGLWRRFELGETPPESLVDPSAGLLAIVALAPDAAEDYHQRSLPLLLQGLRRLGARVTAIVPPGKAPRDPQANVLELAPLFGPGDPCIWPLVPVLRAQKTARLPRGLPPCRPLFVEDAARAALAIARGEGTGARHRLLGADRLDAGALGTALSARFGGSVATKLFGRLPPAALEALTLSAEGDDTWDEAVLGPRKSFTEWVDRLPGPRPRR